jgi:hypothetical protein
MKRAATAYPISLDDKVLSSITLLWVANLGGIAADQR